MKPESQKRKHRYSLNMNEEELKEFKAQAKKSGLSLQDFARSVLGCNLPDDIRRLRTRTERFEEENRSLRDLTEGAELTYTKAQELMDGYASFDGQIKELQAKLSRAPPKPKPRREEPKPERKEPEPEKLSRWARAMQIYGCGPDSFEVRLLEATDLLRERKRQEEKKREEELEAWRKKREEKKKQLDERLRRMREERKQRRWSLSWTR